MQLIASWGVSCEVVSIFSNYIRNLFYIFLVGLEKHVSQPTSPIIILTIRSINESICQSFWSYRIIMIGNGAMIMIGGCRLDSFNLIGLVQSTRMNPYIQGGMRSSCVSVSVSSLHLHLHRTTHGQAWPTSSQTSDMSRTSNSARKYRKTVLPPVLPSHLQENSV